MGICMSAEDRKAAAVNASIDDLIEQDKEVRNKTVKLLLLGAGESGKSTIVKQMRLIHGKSYSLKELKSYKGTVCDNLVYSMRAVLEAMLTLQINLGNDENKNHVWAVMNYTAPDTNDALPENLATGIAALWQDSGVQAAVARANEYQLNDSAAFYFNGIDRIAKPDYVPTTQDVLRSRIRTTGIIETEFEYKSLIYKVFDVGGQRSERRKWIQCFDDVTCVIFVMGLSGFDTKLFEDRETNRIHEALILFEAICRNKFFLQTAMILFLNKTDLFAEKIQTNNLKDYFPDFDGPEKDDISAREYVKELFMEKTKKGDGSAPRQVYPYFTCATDTKTLHGSLTRAPTSLQNTTFLQQFSKSLL